MPVPGGENSRVCRGVGGEQSVDRIDDAIALRNGQCTAGAEVVLDVHDEQSGGDDRRHLTVHYTVMPTALSTDLYELTMAAGYFDAGTERAATFELSVRELPPDRGYLVAAGIEPALTDRVAKALLASPK